MSERERRGEAVSGGSEIWAPPLQAGLFPELENDWRREWVGMPEYEHDDLQPLKSLTVHFATAEDMEAFARLVGAKLYMTTRSIWYPEAEIGRYANKVYEDEP